MSTPDKKVLWWGRSDVDYSRNRIVRQLFTSLGWEIIYFSPRLSLLGDFEAYLRRLPLVDLVWLPCFRQRDVRAACRWANKRKVPLVFDPLISAYDKQVWERDKFSEDSKQANKLLKWERSLFQSVDYLVADTELHAKFYAEKMQIDTAKIGVLPVGAEESLFMLYDDVGLNKPLHILFYGSYIALQGPEIIAEAIQLYDGPNVEWYLIGDGPLRKKVQQTLQGLDCVHFIDWVPYVDLATKIAQADICLGVFGPTEKTQRVIPNKVYQAIACGRPVITSESDAYPLRLREQNNSGLFFVPANDAAALANKIAELAEQPELVLLSRKNARHSYQQYFSNAVLKASLLSILRQVDHL
ncbi:MAG: glycosyltransferase [Pseudomonadota bacterium]|nr:glycosyltransferase [Pseudomonadota bacterium]